MTHGTTTTAAPRGLARLALRMPIWLYQAGLGWLLGARFLMLTHIGRKTGRPRQTVLEVVRHDPATDTYFIASGWGERSDWLRNIQQNPHVLVHSGGRRLEAVAERLPVDAAAEVLHSYARHHSLAFRNLAKLMIGVALDGSAASCRRLAIRVPLVAVRPHD